ncbi:hypothetical protein CEE37_01840 [candidate division LCP-89 bacterium B3_LCP]|uniref:Cell division protein ZapB n=1 Tax=candidate division LCP-89 bacterium B3_LCP TaxID=2012998 RepID=A0A532V5I8_UNCL8|nr:MAG: hypothetical protein CEE37_01840 [candidate division LCP-89 bacterium B3_LCP]
MAIEDQQEEKIQFEISLLGDLSAFDELELKVVNVISALAEARQDNEKLNNEIAVLKAELETANREIKSNSIQLGETLNSQFDPEKERKIREKLQAILKKLEEF